MKILCQLLFTLAQTKDFLNAFLKNDIGILTTKENGIFFLMIKMLHSDKYYIEKKNTKEISYDNAKHCKNEIFWNGVNEHYIQNSFITHANEIQ